jgi:hypothetical protein
VFFELIPQEKLLLVICGIPETDIGDLQKNCHIGKSTRRHPGMETILHVLRMEK